MQEHRPDPEQLLARLRSEQARQTRGKLKIFFGAAAGVGKTYAMLEAARAQKAKGVDVVVGYVETHGRGETEALLDGLEQLPRRQVEYRGKSVPEFDIDAALARHPALILVDELAHTNAYGLRHPKRWQYVGELLDAGINVYTTLNVQHIESLNDVVAQITGVHVIETVPDRMVDRADEVELIDLAPDDLLMRLREGKVYIPEQVERATQNFFRKGNLIALRELALRRTAERVDEQMQGYMREHAISRTWPVTERLLVCVAPGPHAISLVRRARQMATLLHAPWLAIYVETPNHARLPQHDRDMTLRALSLAEQFGAEAITLTGHDVAEEILSYARAHNVTQILVGKTLAPRWRELVRGSVVDHIVRGSGPIDVYVMTAEQKETPVGSFFSHRRSSDWRGYVWAIGVVALCTLLARLMFPYLHLENLILVYLLGVVLVAAGQGRVPSILAALLSVLAFDFFFVPPYLTFAVSDTQYLFTFLVMLLVALVISTLTVRIQEQAEAARLRERRTAALYALSREFAKERGRENLVQVAVRHIASVFDCTVAVLLSQADGNLSSISTGQASFLPDERERGVSQWVFQHQQRAGLGTDTLPGAAALYLPLVASNGLVGVLGIRPADGHPIIDPDQLHLLETFANQTALAIERAALADQAEHSRVQIETERLRNSLLSSVSHDLRTPLATISGASESLLDDEERLDRNSRYDLLRSIHSEAERLGRLISNLLDMTRLESGTIRIKKDFYPLEEIVQVVLARLNERGQLGQVSVHAALPLDLPLIPVDSVLIDQVLTNLLENALRYAPPNSSIELNARAVDGEVQIEVADRGPGIPPGEERHIFDKFYRAPGGANSGVGLGLTICQGIVKAHGGRIWAENRAGGGAVFRFTLPLDEHPSLKNEQEEAAHV